MSKDFVHCTGVGISMFMPDSTLLSSALSGIKKEILTPECTATSLKTPPTEGLVLLMNCKQKKATVNRKKLALQACVVHPVWKISLHFRQFCTAVCGVCRGAPISCHPVRLTAMNFVVKIHLSSAGSSSCPMMSCLRSCPRPRTHCVCSHIWRSALKASLNSTSLTHRRL